eukprot:scaffold18611_cov36-Phaeocystis_antarctica.AAC.1
MRSMLPESRRHGQGQWPRRSARMNWELTLAWARSRGHAACPLVQSIVAVSDGRRARIHWCAR